MPNEQIEERTNWQVLQVICTGCEHLWATLFPDDAINVECPKCQGMTGIPVRDTGDVPSRG